MYKNYLPKEAPEAIPFGQGQIECTQGYWMFNNKRVAKCPAPIQLLVSKFIQTAAIALPVKHDMEQRQAAVTVHKRAGHLVLFRVKVEGIVVERRPAQTLSEHNYTFTHKKQEQVISIPVSEMTSNEPKLLSSYPNIEQIEFVRKEAV